MEKQDTIRTASTVISGIEFVKNDFYKMQPYEVKVLMNILEKGLYYGADGLSYKKAPVQSAPVVRRYLQLAPKKRNDPTNSKALLRTGASSRAKKEEPEYVIKDSYVEQLISLYEATHEEKRSPPVFKSATPAEGYTKASIAPRKDSAPDSVVVPYTPPNEGVLKLSPHVVGPGGKNLPKDWRTRRFK